MPPHTPHHRSQVLRAPYSEAASSLAHATPARPSSYSSLEQALVPPAQPREGNTDGRGDPHSREHPRSSASMSSDGRYMYQGPSEVAAQYGYPQYPPYDAAQYPPSSSRPARNSAPAPHPTASQQPHPAPYPLPPPPGYPQTSYPATPSYGVPPPNPQQWSQEGWSQYPQPFVPPNPPVQEPQTFARPEAQPQPPGEASAPTSGPSNPDNRRTEERPERPPASQSRPRKGKDTEKPTSTPIPPVKEGLDYGKLVESYRAILESTNTLAMSGNMGRDDVLENVKQMLQSALYGQELLDAAVQRSEATHGSASGEHQAEGGEGSSGKARQSSVSRPEQPAEGGQTCLGCSATSTPEWRRGPLGPRTLCNACGLVYAKLIKKRTREPGRSRGSGQSKHGSQGGPDALSSGEDGSDVDSNGSQDRRSDSGDAARR